MLKQKQNNFTHSTNTPLTTYYPSKYYNIDTNNKTTKHIYVNDLLVASISYSPNITTNTNPLCSPPLTNEDWVISSSCTFTGKANALKSVIVNPNTTLTLAPSSTLLMDLKHHKLLVKKNGGVLIKKTATLRQITTKDTEPNINYIHTDHLSSSNVITDNTGNLIQTLDYYPYGSKRLNTGTDVSEREYIGEMFDEDTGLNYLNARYYSSNSAKFISQDPAFIYLTHLNIQLTDPQSWNSYAYARNNPLAFIDANGNMWTPWQSSGGFGNWMGNGGLLYNVYGSNVNSITNTAINIQQNGLTTDSLMALGADVASITAKTSGVIVGSVGVGMGGGATVNVLSPAAVTTGVTACTSGGCQQAQKAVNYTSQYGNTLGSKMNQVAQNLQNSEYNFGDHAIRRIAERIGVGNEGKVTSILNNVKPFEYFHEGAQKLGYYDTQTKIFVGQIKDSMNITTIMTNVSEKYVKGLIK